MSALRPSAFARAAWAVWNTLLVVDVLGLLAVAVYAALASPDDGPGATPLLMAGLLSLCVIVLALVSAVNAVLWASAVGWSWWRRLVLVVLALVGAALVFVAAAHASDPGESSGVRWSGLMLFVLLALGAYFFNAHAVRRYRSRH
jgi:hypothetical protein